MAGKKPGVFSPDSMRRIARVVQKIEGGGRDAPVVRLPRMGDDDGGFKIRLGKTTAEWGVGLAPVAIPIWDAGTVMGPMVSTTAETQLAGNNLQVIKANKFVFLAELEIDGEAVWMVVGVASDDPDVPRLRLGKTTYLWPTYSAQVAIPIWDGGTLANPAISITNETLNAGNILRPIAAGTFVYLAELNINGNLLWYVVAAAETPPLTKLGKVGQQWTTGGAAISIPIWDAGTIGTPLVSNTAETVMAGNMLFTIKSGSWVFLSQVLVSGDLEWHVIAASDTYGAVTIGGADLSIHTGYNGVVNQALGHNANGALKWFDCNQSPDWQVANSNQSNNIHYFGCS